MYVRTQLSNPKKRLEAGQGDGCDTYEPHIKYVLYSRFKSVLSYNNTGPNARNFFRLESRQ